MDTCILEEVDLEGLLVPGYDLLSGVSEAKKEEEHLTQVCEREASLQLASLISILLAFKCAAKQGQVSYRSLVGQFRSE